MSGYNFFDGQYITYKLRINGIPLNGCGYVRGVAMTEQPVIGCLYIIEDVSGNFPRFPEYPYRFFACPESMLNTI